MKTAESSVIDNFVTELSAHMAGVSTEEYASIHEELLSRLQDMKHVVNKITIGSIGEYKKALEFKGLLSSLTCYLFNLGRDCEEARKVEGTLGGKLHKFSLSQRARGDMNSLCKYLLWSKYFGGENIDKIINALIRNGFLLIDQNDNYYIRGLQLAVGDNIFKIGGDGRWHRRYVDVCSLQAFPLPSRWNYIFKEKNVPAVTLDKEVYEVTCVGGGRHCAKISFSRKDRRVVRDKYLAS